MKYPYSTSIFYILGCSGNMGDNNLKTDPHAPNSSILECLKEWKMICCEQNIGIVFGFRFN